MALRTFGGGPADITTDNNGNVTTAVSLRVYNAAVGGQRVTELYDIDGTPLPGVVTSSTDSQKLGRIEFAAADEYSVLFLDPGYGMRWVVPAREAFNLTAAAVEKADRAIVLAENAVTHPQLEEVFLDPARGTVVYPHQFGATGDGVTNDTAAVQAAVDYLNARGGGTLAYDPKHGTGIYRQAWVRLGPNITIEGNGSTVKSTAGIVFFGGSQGGKGYGAYTKNLTVRNIIFRGDFANEILCKLMFHHTENLLIENCQFIEATQSSHAIDMGGCRNVIIRACTFTGYDPAGSDYAECIQVDHSTANGLNNPAGEEGTYDGLPCVNVTVESCTFEPLQIGSTWYAAPTPMGNHVHVENLHENLRFINNTVIDAHTPTAPVTSNGWLHFYGVKGLTVAGNHFEQRSRKAPMIVVRLITRNVGLLPANYGQHGASNTSTGVPTVPSEDVKITGNTFKGFAGDTTGMHTILLEGLDGYPIRGVLIADNQVTDCYPKNRIAAGGNYSGDFISLNYVDDVVVRGNTARDIRNFVYAPRCNNLSVEANTITGCYWWTITSTTSGDNMIVRGNTIRNYGVGIRVTGRTNTVIQGNTLKDSLQIEGASTSGSYTAPVVISGGSRGSVVANIIESAAPPSFQIAQAIRFTGNHSGGLYGSNLQNGHTREATVDSGSTATAK